MTKRHTIEFIRSEFNEFNYTLLSTEYKNAHSKLKYVCDNGHINYITYNSFKKGYRCNLCKRNKPYTYLEVKTIFHNIGYKLLSTKYKNNNTKLKYKCDKGHINYIKLNKLLSGYRCPDCSNRKKYSIESIKELIEKENYKLISTEYKNKNKKLLLEYDKGHMFEMSFGCFKNNKQRCPICYGNKKLTLDFIKKEFSKENYVVLSKNYKSNKSQIRYKCPNGHIHSMMWNSWQQGQRCGKCSNQHSKAELDVFEFIKSYFEDAVSGDKILISPYELDIIIPSKKIAIEYCGLYWHSESNGKDKNYHLNKLQKCNNIGYQLITIFEDEWINKKDIVKNRLLHILNVSDSINIYARTCTIKEINSKSKNKFLNKFHIQGKDKSLIKLGAYYNNDLVSVMTFSKGSIAKGTKDKKDIYELNRFCSDYNYHIVGIAGKLLAFFIKNYKPKEIFSYSDKRWSNGNLYKKIGFKFVHDSSPNYWYIDGVNRYHIFNFRKSILSKKLSNFNPDLSEVQNMYNNGYNRIFDCGNSKWSMNIK